MKRLLWFLGSALLVAGLFFKWGDTPPLYRLLLYPTSAVPHPYEPENAFTLLKAEVTSPVDLFIDSLGIPHIHAESEVDAAVAIGFVQARDRLFQMEMIRRSVMGRVAEVAGSAALNSDRFWRKFHFREGAIRAMDRIRQDDPEQFAVYEGYARGINLYLTECYPHERPPEFTLLGFDPEPFEAWNIILLIKAMAKDLCYREDDLGFSQAAALLPPELVEQYYPWESPRAFPIFPELELAESAVASAPNAQNPSIIPMISQWESPVFNDDTRSGLGSNNWAVSRQKTEEGTSFLCNDTHLKLRLPGTWYEMSVQVGEHRRRGMSIPGAPFIISGYTDSVAWGMTNATWDLTDFYSLELSTTGDSAWLDSGWVSLEVYYDTIYISGDAPRIFKNRMSPFGPLDTIHGNYVATDWNARIFGNEGAAFQKLQTANHWDEAAEALAWFSQPPQNFILADHRGNTGLVTAGLARRNPLVQRGIFKATSLRDTATYFHTAPLLREKNSERGWSGSANQNHVNGTASSWFSYRYAATGRGRRIHELLSDSTPFNRFRLKAMQMDAVDVEWNWLKPLIMQRIPDEWRVYLEDWNGSCDTNSVAATLFVLIKENTTDAFFKRLPENLGLYPGTEWVLDQVANERDIPLPNGAFVSADALLNEGIASTRAYLDGNAGPDPESWSYGAFHKTHIEHLARIEPWNAAPFSSRGSNRTLNVAKGLRVTHGASMRTLIEWTPRGPLAEMMVTGGQSGRPGDRNYQNQLRDFRAGTLHPAPLFESERESKRAVYHYHLEP